MIAYSIDSMLGSMMESMPDSSPEPAQPKITAEGRVAEERYPLKGKNSLPMAHPPVILLAIWSGMDNIANLPWLPSRKTMTAGWVISSQRAANPEGLIRTQAI